jgi:inner membrane protein
MNTGAHLQFGWLIGHAREFDRTERAIITLAAVAPDLDGLLIVAGPGSEIFYKYHHILFHNALSAIVYVAIVAACFSRRSLVLLLCLLSFLGHILVDYVTAPWEMAPFWPVSPMLVNLGSRLPGWVVQYVFQVAGMAAILACTVWLYLKYGRTPLEVISPRLDRLVIGYLVLPWKNRCGYCSSRAHFRCERCGQTVCGRHWQPHGLVGTCPACASDTSQAGACGA